MLETLNETFPEEISMNILKFMTNETAVIIKKEIKNIRCNCTRKLKPMRYFINCYECEKKMCMTCRVYDKNTQGRNGDEIICGICSIDHLCYLDSLESLEKS